MPSSSWVSRTACPSWLSTSMTASEPRSASAALLGSGCQSRLMQVMLMQTHHAVLRWLIEPVRAQIHLLRNGSVCVFSRNCEDRSQAFPDVATAIRTAARGLPCPTHVMYNLQEEQQGTHRWACRSRGVSSVLMF